MATVTVGTGGTYATIADAYAAIGNTATEPWVFQLLDQEHFITANTPVVVCTPTNNITIEAAPGANWNDKTKPCREDTGARVTLTAVWSVSVYMVFRNIQLKLANSSGYFNIGNNVTVGGVAALTIDSVFHVDARVSVGTPFWYIQNYDVSGPLITNCIFLYKQLPAYYATFHKVLIDSNVSISTARAANNLFILPPYAPNPGSNMWTASAQGYDGDEMVTIKILNNLYMGRTSGNSMQSMAWELLSTVNAAQWAGNTTSLPSWPDPNGSTLTQAGVNPAELFVAWTTDPATCDFRIKPGGLALLDAGSTAAASYTTKDAYGDTRTGSPVRGPFISEYIPGLALEQLEPVKLTGTLSVEASITMGKSLNFTADIALAGTMGIEAAFKASLPYLAFSGELALTGTMGVEATLAFSTKITTGLPDGWYILKVLESVPNPNFGTPYGQNYFVRWTYLGYDDNDIMLAASGSDLDCYGQLLSVAQSRTQQLPYTGI